MSKEYLNRPVNTPEEIVGLMGNFGNRPDQRELQEFQVKAIKEYAARALEAFVAQTMDCAITHIDKMRAIHPPGVVMDPGKRLDYVDENKFNGIERDFGSPMTEEEVAAHFGEPPPEKKVVKSVNEMTLEEIESLEKGKDNSNDIYKISARVKNLARGTNVKLTPVGDALCNTYTHVLKSFYDFANTLDSQTKNRFVNLIRSHEKMPGDVIASANTGVKTKQP